MHSTPHLRAFCLLVPVLAAAGELRAQPQIQAANITANEGNTGSADAVLTVTLSAAAAGVVTVAFATENLEATGGASCGGSADYVSETGTVQFNPGETRKSLGIALCGDTADEPNENFRVRFSNAVGGTIQGQTARITIADDDEAAPAPLPTLSIRDLRIIEGTGPAEDIVNGVGVTLSAASDQLVTATITFNVNPPNTATQGTSCAPNVDFVAAASTVRILPRAVFLNSLISIFPCRDTVDEPDETFQVELSNPVGATLGDGLATVTIVDDDLGTVIIIPPTISIGDVSVSEGSSAVFPLTLSAAPAETVSVQFATAPRTARAGTTCGSFPDYLTRTGRVTFPPGGTAQVIVVPVCFDFSAESAETFTVTLSSPANATIARAVGTATIR